MNIDEGIERPVLLWFGLLDGDQKDQAVDNIRASESFRQSFDLESGMRQTRYHTTRSGARAPVYSVSSKDELPLNPRGIRIARIGLRSQNNILFYSDTYSSMRLGGFAGVSPFTLGILEDTTESDNGLRYSMIFQNMEERLSDRLESAKDMDSRRALAYQAGSTLGRMLDMRLTGSGLCYSKNWVLNDHSEDRPHMKCTLFNVNERDISDYTSLLLYKIDANKESIFGLLSRFDVLQDAAKGIDEAIPKSSPDRIKAKEVIRKRFRL